MIHTVYTKNLISLQDRRLWALDALGSGLTSQTWTRLGVQLLWALAHQNRRHMISNPLILGLQLQQQLQDTQQRLSQAVPQEQLQHSERRAQQAAQRIVQLQWDAQQLNDQKKNLEDIGSCAG